LGDVLGLEDRLQRHVVAGGQIDAGQRDTGLDAELVLLDLKRGQDLGIGPPGDDQVADLIQVDADGALAVWHQAVATVDLPAPAGPPTSSNTA
jgi:hypothetical protein